ncbi:MAG: DUF1573 domain-containing protein [Planctomycetaceae bacterium]|jgi:hypothetical protein|nr:DUF1573 domain-containing protein [Planctomycetaceae bacterium]
MKMKLKLKLKFCVVIFMLLMFSPSVLLTAETTTDTTPQPNAVEDTPPLNAAPQNDATESDSPTDANSEQGKSNADKADKADKSGADKSDDDDLIERIIKKSDREFDFKSLAAGAYSEHKFVLTNPFKETLRIASVSSSCSCTVAFVQNNKTVLQTYEKAEVVVRLQSVDGKSGQRNSTITVTFDQPFSAEVQLNTRGEIRSDILIMPRDVRFENVDEGTSKTRTLSVTYSGRNAAWRIVDVKSTNPHITAKIESAQKYPNQITTAQIKILLDEKMPKGEFAEQIILISNDAEGRRELPVFVTGRVGVTISVAPETVFLGYLKAGEPSQTKSVLLKGTKPFKIKNLLCDNPAVITAFEIQPDTPPKQIYIIPLQYLNPETGDGSPKNGQMEAKIIIETDLPNTKPTVKLLMEITK